MKVLVLGATGMAGHLISLYFLEKGENVITFSNTPFKYANNIVGDALNTDTLTKVLLDNDFDVVINCIGLLNQTANSNPSKSIFLNSYLPHFIVDVLKEKETKLIQMSTDCVFNGNTGPYYENSFQDGSTIYDRTKALGEINDNKNFTFRNSIIGPDMNSSGIGLFNWFMHQKGSLNGFANAMWTGVTTLTLAKAMHRAIIEDITGLYNLVNNESISKYELLVLFSKHFKNSSVVINSVEKPYLDKSLRSTRTDFSFLVPSYEEMIVEMKEWVLNHRDLYPFYF